MAVYDNIEGTLTLGFYRLIGGKLKQLRSAKKTYATIDHAWVGAKEALLRYPRISYAEIIFQPHRGSPRAIEKVER